jgi:hypothetical protein
MVFTCVIIYYLCKSIFWAWKNPDSHGDWNI